MSVPQDAFLGIQKSESCCSAPQDAFISFLLRMQETHSCLETMQKMERWIMEHRADPRGSRLVRARPQGIAGLRGVVTP